MRNKETLVQWILATVALSAIAVLALIIIFIFKEGSPIIARLGLTKFHHRTKWSPTKGMFGIFPMILGSIQVTLGALLIGVPIGLATAIFLAEWRRPEQAGSLKSAIQLLAGIPSVVFGFIGLVILVPFYQANGWAARFLGPRGCHCLRDHDITHNSQCVLWTC